MLLEAKVHKKQHLGLKNSCIEIVTPTMARPSYGIQSALGNMAHGYVFCSHLKSIMRLLSRKKTYILMRQFFLRIRSMAIVDWIKEFQMSLGNDKAFKEAHIIREYIDNVLDN